jgi:hypothetical protein
MAVVAFHQMRRVSQIREGMGDLEMGRSQKPFLDLQRTLE